MTTVAATRLHWSATGLAENDIRIHGVHIDTLFENKVGDPTPCATPGKITLYGTLGTGAAGSTTWGAVLHQVSFENALGLAAQGSFGTSVSAPVTGTFTDTVFTLTLT